VGTVGVTVGVDVRVGERVAVTVFVGVACSSTYAVDTVFAIDPFRTGLADMERVIEPGLVGFVTPLRTILSAALLFTGTGETKTSVCPLCERMVEIGVRLTVPPVTEPAFVSAGKAMVIWDDVVMSQPSRDGTVVSIVYPVTTPVTLLAGVT